MKRLPAILLGLALLSGLIGCVASRPQVAAIEPTYHFAQDPEARAARAWIQQPAESALANRFADQGDTRGDDRY